MTKQEAKQNIAKLVEKYKATAKAGDINSYNEAQTRNEFIEPLFEFLGWDMRNLENPNEVTTEENVSKGRVDLAFRLNHIPVMFLEAKAMRVDLDEWKWAEQAINYSWNKSVTWAILTDFEGIKIFNAEIPPKSLSDNLFFELKWNEYIDRFDQLWLLSKESFEQELLATEAEKWGKLTKRKQVGDKLFEDLLSWRTELSKNFKKHNTIDEDALNEGVQKILDRLIFIRTAEDRQIEQNILLSLLRQWETSGKKQNIYKRLTDGFRWFDDNYNSKLFTPHTCESWQADDKVFENIIRGLYKTKDGYRYDFSAISADVLGGIYEQYLSFVQEKASKSSEQKKSKRKEQGIYYTPKYIVEYLMEHTLGEVLKKTKKNDLPKIKILDPACGSGSFLTAAFDRMLEATEKLNPQTSFFMQSDILKNNIYGTDLDEQAIEIAQLNLLLKVLKQRAQLPTLKHNLRVGNSLISGNMEKLEPYFGDKWRKQKPFNFREEFTEVFEQDGFDVIIGNPPYGAKLIKSQQEYLNKEFNIGSTDTAIVFIKKSFDILKNGGRFGFIVPKAFCFALNWKKIREYIGDNIEIIVDCGKVWKNVKLEQVIFIIHKGRKKSFYYSSKFTNGQIKNIGKVYKKDVKDFGFFLNGVTEYEIQIARKIKNKSLKLNDISTNQRGAILQKHISSKGDKSIIGGAQIQRSGVNGIKGKIDSSNINSGQAYIKENSILVQRIVAHITKPIDHIKITACVPEDRDLIIVDTINQITLNEKYNPYFITAILHSQLINWYVYKFIFGKAIRTMQFDNPTTSRLPIPEVSESEQEKIAKQSKLMLELQRELQEITENTDKYSRLKAEIEKLDKEIDHAIYKLYDLTEKEIRTIENS